MTVPLDRPDDEEIGLGELRIFPRLGLLMRQRTRLEVGRRAFDVLLALVEARGGIVSKDDLIARVWPGEVVEENNLQAHVSALRRALGPDRALIATVFNRGYRLEQPSDAAPPVRAEPAEAAHVVPLSPLSPLIGRDGELATLCEILDAHPLVTIAGAGGIGKTRVALELVRRVEPRFRDGVFVIELAPLSVPGLVMPTVLRKLQIGIGAGNLSRETREALKERRLLVVVDNCEHLLDETADAIARVMQLIPHARVVATTQEPLGLDGEQVVRLSPLGVPPEHARSLEEVLRYPAARFLEQRVRAAEKEIPLSDAHAAAIAVICRRLDGIPLALELAAARVSQVGLDDVVAGLSDRFSLLTAGRRTAMPRQQTLRAALDWSYGLLTGDEQNLLQRLGVFAGPFTLAAAAAIARPDVADVWHVADLLGALATKSMVVKDFSGCRARFHLLESVRTFALEKLAPTGDFPGIAARHAAYFQARVAYSAAGWRMTSSEAWLEEFADDVSDVRAALDWTFSSDEDPGVGIRSLCASLPFWMQLSLLGECREQVERAIDRFAHVLRDEPRLDMQLNAALGASTTWACGPVDGARFAWQRALRLAMRLDDAEHRLQCYYGLWLCDLRSQRYATSLNWGEKLLAEALSGGDAEAEAAGRRVVGVAWHFLGGHARGAEMIRAMIAPAGSGLDTPFALRFGLDQQTAALAFLARAICVQGDTVRAHDAAGQAVRAAERVGHVLTLCCALLEGSCTVAALTGDRETLHRHAGTAIAVAESHGLEFWRLYAQTYRDFAALLDGPTPAAIERMLGTLAALRGISFDLGYTVVVPRLAEWLADLGRRDEALSLIDEVLRGQAGSPTHWLRPELLRVKANVLAAAGRPDAALLKEALRLAQGHGAGLWEARFREASDHRPDPSAETEALALDVLA